MDRQILLDRLLEAEQRVAACKNDIQEQYRLIAELMRHGEDTVEAMVVLNRLIEPGEARSRSRSAQGRGRGEIAGGSISALGA
jgi:hypothetical protein